MKWNVKLIPEGKTLKAILVFFVIVVIVIALTVGIYLVKKNCDLEKEKADLVEKVAVLEAEDGNLETCETEKADMVKKIAVLEAEAVVREAENKGMKSLLTDIKPVNRKTYDLSESGNMCQTLTPWIIDIRDKFLDFDIRIKDFLSDFSVIYPIHNEFLDPNSDCGITWRSSADIKRVRIQYSNNNGKSWTTITGSTEKKIYWWWTPKSPGDYILKISSLSGEYVTIRKFAIGIN